MGTADFKNLHRRGSRRASAPPALPFVSFDLFDLLREVMSVHFPGTEIAASVSFLRASLSRTHPLTSIRNDDRTAKIGIHEILNRSDTPREVIEFILGHELLHMVIRPRQIDGRVVNHPPEFWDAEVSLFPTRTLVWAWLYEALWSCLKVDKMREVTMVRRGWHNKVSNPFPTLKHIRAGVEADAKIMRYL